MKFVQLAVALAIASSQALVDAAGIRRNQKAEARPRGKPRAKVVERNEKESVNRTPRRDHSNNAETRQHVQHRAHPNGPRQQPIGKPRTQPVAPEKPRTNAKTTVGELRGKEKARTNHRQDGPQTIVNGQDADEGEYPYFVDLGGCGGSLIAPHVVLSAAHCAVGVYSGQKVIVNGYKRGEVTTDAVEAGVIMYANHPMYNDMNMANDIMLIQLEEPITVTTPVTLSVNGNPSMPTRGQMLTVIGVGVTEENGFQSDILQELEVPAVSLEACNDEDSYNGEIIDEVMFCAGIEAGGQDSCQGDSGGPIVVVNGNNHVQVGVVSWGYGCARENLPGVYARTSSAMDWIKFVTCECWGYTDQSICTGYTNSGIGFECPTVDDMNPTNPTYPPACELIEGWVDDYGDPCGWYEQQDTPTCPNFGSITGTDGYTAWEACCFCEGGGVTGTEFPTGGVSDSPGCELIEGWVDEYGDSCGWYEQQDTPTCPNFGSITGTDGYTAWEACCVCEGGGFPTDGAGIDDDDHYNYDDHYNWEPCTLVEGWSKRKSRAECCFATFPRRIRYSRYTP